MEVVYLYTKLKVKLMIKIVDGKLFAQLVKNGYENLKLDKDYINELNVLCFHNKFKFFYNKIPNENNFKILLNALI